MVTTGARIGAEKLQDVAIPPVATFDEARSSSRNVPEGWSASPLRAPNSSLHIRFVAKENRRRMVPKVGPSCEH